MNKYFTTQGLQNLKEHISLLSIIRKQVKLKKFGNGYIGRCPFCKYHKHSFVVTPKYNKWLCFGHCNIEGTIIDWYKNKYNISVGRAIYMLAKKYPQFSKLGQPTLPKYIEVTINLKIASQNLIKQVIGHYKNCLIENEIAMQYIKERCFTMPLIEEFQIGYCNGYLAKTLSNQHTPDRELLKKELIEAGLLMVNYSTGNLIERFNKYIIIPEFDSSGNIVKIFGQLVANKTITGSLAA